MNNTQSNIPHFDTFLEYFYYHEKTSPNKIYLRQAVGDSWQEYTWAEVGQQARRMANALKATGLPANSHIGLISKNCPHWVIADLAILIGGFISVPFYATLTAEQLKEVCELGHVKAMFIGKLDEWDEMKTGIPESIHCIRFPHYAGNAKIDKGDEWDDLLKQNAPLAEGHIPQLDDLFTIIYTSGTTGTPKGVMLTYRAPATLLGMERKHGVFKLYQGAGERFLSYLPLNHIAERALGEITSFQCGTMLSFVESLDTFAKNLADTQPTTFFAVPRIWTKFQQGILAKFPESRLNLLLKLPLISGIIKKKVRETLGLSEAVTILTGAAPTPVSTIEFFKKFDIHIQEVYGMTETCGGMTLMPKENIKPGTVGKPFPEADVKIDKETGEVLHKAPWLMTGYYEAPEATAKTLRDGYLHSGDQGELDRDGYLRITGRVQDTFKSAKGKYILPVPIESQFARNPYIEQICVIGLGLPQPMALLNLSELGQGVDQATIDRSLQGILSEVNAELHSYEKVHCMVVIKEPWTVENNLLTPTLKIKRNVMHNHFSGDYEQWYEQGKSVIWV